MTADPDTPETAEALAAEHDARATVAHYDDRLATSHLHERTAAMLRRLAPLWQPDGSVLVPRDGAMVRCVPDTAFNAAQAQVSDWQGRWQEQAALAGRMREERDAAREVLKGIAAPKYGIQGIMDDYWDTNAFNFHAMKYWASLVGRYEQAARAALASPPNPAADGKVGLAGTTAAEGSASVELTPLDVDVLLEALNIRANECNLTDEEVEHDCSLSARLCDITFAAQPVEPGTEEPTPTDATGPLAGEHGGRE